MGGALGKSIREFRKSSRGEDEDAAQSGLKKKIADESAGKTESESNTTKI